MLLKVIACVIAFLLILLVALLFTNLHVRVVYDSSLAVNAYFGLIRFKLYPKKEKRKSKEDKSKKAEQVKKDTTLSKEKSNPKAAHLEKSDKSQDTKSTRNTLGLIYDIVKSFGDMLGKRARINIRKLTLSVSRPDAGDTAILFGICQGAVSGIVALSSLFGKSKLNEKNIEVIPDFLSGKSKLCTDIDLSAKTIFVLKSIISGYISNSSKKQNRKDGEKI